MTIEELVNEVQRKTDTNFIGIGGTYVRVWRDNNGALHWRDTRANVGGESHHAAIVTARICEHLGTTSLPTPEFCARTGTADARALLIKWRDEASELDGDDDRGTLIAFVLRSCADALGKALGADGGAP